MQFGPTGLRLVHDCTCLWAAQDLPKTRMSHSTSAQQPVKLGAILLQKVRGPFFPAVKASPGLTTAASAARRATRGVRALKKPAMDQSKQLQKALNAQLESTFLGTRALANDKFTDNVAWDQAMPLPGEPRPPVLQLSASAEGGGPCRAIRALPMV